MKRIALIAVVFVFLAVPAWADSWVDVPVLNADFELFTGTAPAVSFTGWLQEDMELGTNLGNSTNWAKFDNPGGSDAEGNIRQRITAPEGTTELRIGFDFRGFFGDNPNEQVDPGTDIDALFRAILHADSDDTGTALDMHKVVYRTNETTGWMSVVSSWSLPEPVGSQSPNVLIKFRWDRFDDRLNNAGVDNVWVQAVPVPGAVLLGMLGLGAAGIKLRRRSA